MLVENLDTWLNTIGTGEKKTELGKIQDWNMDQDGGERELIDKETI